MKSPPPLVSIVLPVYNGDAYLKDALQSCLDQTYPHWELLIVDDASNDNTPAIIAEFAEKDARIHALRHDKNRRLPATLNTGFAHAQGEYLTWTSDDNRYRPQALEEMVSTLENNQQIDFLYTDYDVISQDGQYIQTNSVPTPPELIQGYNAIPCFLFRRRVYECLGAYAEEVFLAEDYDYLLRVFSSGFKMCPLHTSLYQYRRHPQSLTDTHKGQTFLAAEQALLRNLPKMTWASARARGQAYLYLASLATWQGDPHRAARYALSALCYAPGPLLGKFASYAMKQAVRKMRAITHNNRKEPTR